MELKRFKIRAGAEGPEGTLLSRLVRSVAATITNKRGCRPFTKQEVQRLRPADLKPDDVVLVGDYRHPETWAEHGGQMRPMVADGEYELILEYEIGSSKLDTRRHTGEVERDRYPALFIGFAPDAGHCHFVATMAEATVPA